MAEHDMRATRARMPGGIATLAVLVVALMLALIVVRKTIVAAFANSHPDITLRLVPGNADALIALASARSAAMAGRVDREAERLARAALYGAPLAVEPLAFAALARSDTSLAEAAFRRDPRSRGARLMLLDRALRQRDYPAAFAQIDRLILLEPASRDALFAAMTALAREPASSPALVRLMDTNPVWRADFLKTLNHERADSGLIFRLTRGSAGGEVAQGSAEEQAALLTALVESGDYERAYLAWVNFLPASALSAVAPVYDGAFERRPGAPPFNWKLTGNENGSVEYSKPHGLRADFFGAAPTTLASQILLLAPGSYRLGVQVSGSAASAGGTLSWTLSCIGARDPIGAVPLTGLGAKPVARSIKFQIPMTGCKAQRLTLNGEPAEFPAPIHATTTNISIVPAS